MDLTPWHSTFGPWKLEFLAISSHQSESLYIHVVAMYVLSRHRFLLELEYIMITNRDFIHRIDINETRLQTPVYGLKNATSLDYHYR